MNFSIKKTLTFWILFFSCFSLCRAEDREESPCFVECKFWEKEDCIKLKILLPEGTMAKSTLYKIDSLDPNGVSIRIKNDQLKCLKAFYQLVDIEVHAVPFHEEGGVTFHVIENLEKISTNKKILKDTVVNSTKYFVKTDKEVNFKNDIIPQLTFSSNSPDIKYLRFFTKP